MGCFKSVVHRGGRRNRQGFGARHVQPADRDKIAMFGLSVAEHALLWLPGPAYAVAWVPLCRSLVGSPSGAAAVLKFRTLHNAAMALFSLVMTVLAVRQLSFRAFTPHGQLCQAAAEHAPIMVYAWYVSKFGEWIDSTMLLAQGKPLSALHWNHHATTATVVASHFVGRARRRSIFDVPLLLNAAVHTLMYAYYAAPKRLRPLRQFITSAQIVQHCTVLVSILFTSGTRLMGGECDVSDAANALSFGLYAMYLTQFLIFYVKSYLTRRAADPTALDDEKKSTSESTSADRGERGTRRRSARSVMEDEPRAASKRE